MALSTTFSNKLAHHGYDESRREQSRMQEEFSLKEKPLQYTQTQNTHEMGEVRRAQESRVEEFFV